MIPQSLRTLCDQNRFVFRRVDVPALEKVLLDLRVPSDAEYSEFLRSYTMQFASSKPEELIDPVDGRGQVNATISWAWEAWEMPSNLIALTTLEGEGGYFLDVETGKVVDFTLGGESTDLQPSFFSFMTWYLSDTI